MKKSELQEHSEEYHRRMQVAATAEANGYYREAIDWAMSAWPYIDGMMQYERRYNEKDFHGIDAIDLVLRYAPLILSLAPLLELERLLVERKRIEKNTEEDVTDKLSKAKALLYSNHQLWQSIVSSGQICHDPLSSVDDNKHNTFRRTLHIWQQIGLIDVTNCNQGQARYSFVFPLSEMATGVCGGCGQRLRLPVVEFLDDLFCHTCNTARNHVIVDVGAEPDRSTL